MRRRFGTAHSLSQASSVSSESSSILAISIFAYSAVPSSRLRLVFVVPSLLTAARLLLLGCRRELFCYVWVYVVLFLCCPFESAQCVALRFSDFDFYSVFHLLFVLYYVMF